MTDFFGGDSAAAKNKKKPNEGIAIDRKNDEKPKKKPEIVKKTAKNSAATKVKSEPENEGSLLDNLESTLEELATDEKPSAADDKNESNAAEENDEDDDDEEEDDISKCFIMI